jgi:hypothetical protein
VSIPEEKQPFARDGTASLTRTATFMAQEGEDGCMAHGDTQRLRDTNAGHLPSPGAHPRGR